MIVKINLIIEGPNNKLLLNYGESGLSLPSFNASDDLTLKEHITNFLIGIGIDDVVDEDVNMYNFDDILDGEHVIYATYKIRTKKNKTFSNLNYKFMNLSSVKDNLDKFNNVYDAFVTRLYILNPYS